MARVVVLRNPANPWYDDFAGHSMAAKKGWQHRRRHMNPWYGDPEGHSRASRLGWQHRRHHGSHRSGRHLIVRRHRRHHNPTNPIREHLGISLEEILAALASFIAVTKASDLVFPAPSGYTAQPWDQQQLKEIFASGVATAVAGFIGNEFSPSVKRAAILGGIVKTGMQIIAQFNIPGIAQPGSLIIGDHKPAPMLPLTPPLLTPMNAPRPGVGAGVVNP